jgi:hypothetical protein
LANVYFTLHMRHEKQGGNLSVVSLYSIVGSYLTCARTNHRWTRWISTNGLNFWHLLPKTWSVGIQRSSTSKKSSSAEGNSQMCQFIGSKACKNCNPILALRQLGRLMWEKPEEKYLECLVLNDMGANDHGMFQKIIRAWGNVNKKRKWLETQGWHQQRDLPTVGQRKSPRGETTIHCQSSYST